MKPLIIWFNGDKKSSGFSLLHMTAQILCFLLVTILVKGGSSQLAGSTLVIAYERFGFGHYKYKPHQMFRTQKSSLKNTQCHSVYTICGDNNIDECVDSASHLGIGERKQKSAAP